MAVKSAAMRAMPTAAAVLPQSFEADGDDGMGQVFTSHGITPQAECHTDRRRAETIMETDVFSAAGLSAAGSGRRY